MYLLIEILLVLSGVLDKFMGVLYCIASAHVKVTSYKMIAKS